MKAWKCILMVMVLSVSLITSVKAEGKVDVDVANIFSKIDGGDKPIVVLDAPYGRDSVWTNKLALELRETKEIRVFQYDRPGLGKSSVSKLERTPKNKAIELHSVLKARGVNEFYYVGFSLGGLMIREYAYLYPNEVKGIVMLDCMNEWTFRGIENFLNSLDKKLIKEFESQFEKEDGSYEDLKKGIEEIEKIKEVDSLRKIPLVVMEGNCHGFGYIYEKCQRDFFEGQKMELKWKEWQKNMSQLSDYSQIVEVDVYSYFVQKTETKYILGMIGAETDGIDFSNEELLFMEGPYRPDNLPWLRFFGLRIDGLGW